MGIFQSNNPENIVPLNSSAEWFDSSVDAETLLPGATGGFPETPRWGTVEEEQRQLQKEKAPSIEELLADPCVRSVVEETDNL